MREDPNKKAAERMDDSQLKQITGGASDSVYLNETNLPGGWVVTCSNCGLQFFINSNKDCPSCACTEVYMTYSNDKPIYDSVKFYGK